MADDEQKKEDWKIIVSPEAQAELDKDPEAQAQVRELSARLRQVMGEVDAGRIGSLEEAMRSIGMEQVSVEELAKAGIIPPQFQKVSDSFTPQRAMDICKKIYGLLYEEKLAHPEIFMISTLLVAITAKATAMPTEIVVRAVEGAVDVIDSMMDAAGMADMMKKKDS